MCIRDRYYGKEVIITLPSNLDKDKTYVISLNSNLSDEQNVKLNENIVIPISLSNSINQAAIKGKIFGSMMIYLKICLAILKFIKMKN